MGQHQARSGQGPAADQSRRKGSHTVQKQRRKAVRLAVARSPAGCLRSAVLAFGFHNLEAFGPRFCFSGPRALEALVPQIAPFPDFAVLRKSNLGYIWCISM